MSLFFELIQVALGTRDKLSRVPSANEWNQIYAEAQRQAVTGVIVEGLDKLSKGQRPNQILLLEWIGAAEVIRQRNEILNKRCVEIKKFFRKAGFRGCILKGQGNALMYPNPKSRMPGDIDIWIDGERSDINKFVDSLSHDTHKGYKDVAFHYEDVEVEAHFFPTYLNGFFKNKKLQCYIEGIKERQFLNYEDIGGGSKLCVPTDDFNVVYQMCHLYHHFFCEGIGLRHFIDYYYLLRRFANNKLLLENYHLEVVELFRKLGMLRFVSGVMWVEKEILGIESEYLIADVDESVGQLILKEIIEYGNFNKANMEGKNVLASKLSITFRPLKYLFQFPKESFDRIVFLVRLQFWKVFAKE